MPINSDLSDLPQGDKPEGRPPDEDADIVGRLAAAFYEKYLSDGRDSLAMAIEGARWRASWSDMCSRRVGYEITLADTKRELGDVIDTLGGRQGDDLTDEESDDLAEAEAHVDGFMPTDPPGVAEFWRFSLGTFVHEAMQALAADAFPNAEAEVTVAIDDFGAAHVDLVIDDPDGPFPRTVVEIKSDNAFHFKLATTKFKGPAEGPRSSAVVQGAVAAEALKADRLIVAVFALELLSPDMAAQNGRDDVGRFSAQWSYLPDEFLPIAEKERKRVRRILELVDAGELPPRHAPGMPSGARITDLPRSGWTLTDDSGAIVRAGELWNGQYCRSYCPFFSQCIGDGPS